MFLPKLFSIAGVRTLRLQSTISMQDDHWNTKYVGRPADFMIKDQDKMTQFAHAEVLSYSSLTKAVCVTYGFGSAGLNLPMLKFSQRFQLVASQIWMVEWIISACRLRQSWSVTESMISQEISCSLFAPLAPSRHRGEKLKGYVIFWRQYQCMPFFRSCAKRSWLNLMI